MTKLSVNVNKVALLRNTRDINIPNVLNAAKTAVAAGAHGITVHPRPDQRHIRPADVFEIAEWLRSQPSVEFNIEGNPFPDFMSLVERVRPHQCTLVPDSPDQSTSDHGWDIQRDGARLEQIVYQLHRLGCRVSVFMDSDIDQIRLVPETGADLIELYTEPYAVAFTHGEVEASLARYAQSAKTAQDLGLGVNAGHDLNLHNLPKFLTIPGIAEVSIGHALIADALDVGLHRAVQAYIEITQKSASS
jgi:pyridoxine 5-phosphate synthase